MRRWHLPALVVLFVASRAWMAHLGVRFDASPLDYYWQYADPRLLREDLLRTVFYLHSQPPLFNLWLGCILKLFPVHYTTAFSWSFYGLGLLLTVTTFSTLALLRVPRWFAFVVTAVFIMAPDVILYERWLFYEYPAMELVAVLAYLFCRFIADGRMWCAGGAATVAAVLSLTVSAFHPLWVALIVVALCLLRRHSQRRVLLWCVLPLVTVASAGIKQRVVFGHWGMGTWHTTAAASLTTVLQVPLGWREELAKQGKISQWSLHGSPYSDQLSDFAGLVEIHEWGVPVLDEITKSTGYVNRMHSVYLEMADAFTRDSLYVAKYHPEIIEPFGAMVRPWLFTASNDCPFVPHFEWLSAYVCWHERIVFGAKGGFLALGLILPLLAGLRTMWRGMRGRVDKAHAAAVGFLVANVIGLNFPMIVLGCHEQQRYRFRTAALSVVLAALLMVQVGRVVARMWRAFGPDMEEKHESV